MIYFITILKNNHFLTCLADRNCRYSYFVIFIVKTIYGGGMATIDSIYYWRLLGLGLCFIMGGLG